jgi:5'(3')-deoxyribonucleotidase
MKPRVFLDLDGVVRDFVTGCAQWFDVPDLTPESCTYWKAPYDFVFAKHKDMTVEHFWRSLEDSFWINLPFTPEAHDVLTILEKFSDDAEVCILTSPSQTSAGATQQWIAQNLPEYFETNRYLIGSPKHLCARPGSVLIDDYTRNIERFRCHGGRGILFPRPWNGNGHSDPVKTMATELEAFLYPGVTSDEKAAMGVR